MIFDCFFVKCYSDLSFGFRLLLFKMFLSHCSHFELHFVIEWAFIYQFQNLLSISNYLFDLQLTKEHHSFCFQLIMFKHHRNLNYPVIYSKYFQYQLSYQVNEIINFRSIPSIFVLEFLYYTKLQLYFRDLTSEHFVISRLFIGLNKFFMLFTYFQ